MRALLVVNPNATTTTERSRDVLTRALRSEVDLEVGYTEGRGHAAQLAREAARGDVEVIVTLGGDGTVSEVVNGMLTDGPGPQVPALAVVPGGSTNVFARALGLPADWAEGTGVILEALREKRTRTIGLGRADDRWFTCSAGLGLDAATIQRVEQARTRGHTATKGLYVRSALLQYLTGTDRRTAPITLSRPGAEPQRHLSLAIVQNTAPWTYFGTHPVNPNPDAGFDTGLDVLALRGLPLAASLRVVQQTLSLRARPRGKRVVSLHDISEFTLSCLTPLAFQVDGDYLDERDEITFRSAPEALRVVC
ncbi:diacylglycerol kinase family protein [Actinocatenispora sera]|uniref:diacylglycerol/lipid kinase family protein n=1 Tax=Actinocatenispora sera TaxID=390989 RepID=UPI0033F308A1